MSVATACGRCSKGVVVDMTAEEFEELRAALVDSGHCVLCIVCFVADLEPDPVFLLNWGGA